MGAPQYEQAGADIGGTGTPNTIPRWTGPSTLGDSGLIDDGSAVYTTTRNVGIGTASPGAKLDVSDTANQLRATVSNATPAVTTYALGTREGYISARQENSGSFNVFTDLVSSTSQFTPSGIRFFTHASGDASISERARIDSAGRLLVGTSTVASSTDVRQIVAKTGDVYTQYANTTTNGGAVVGSLNSGFGIYTYTGGIGSESYVERLRVSPSGTQAQSQVAIGTSSFTTGRALTTVADLDVFGIRVGRGANGVSGNIAIGQQALDSGSLSGSENVAIGFQAANGLTTGNQNVAMAPYALGLTTSGTKNVAIGFASMYAMTTTSGNVSLGFEAGRYINSGAQMTQATDSILIGRDARASANAETNQIVIGTTAVGNGSNTTTIGNSSTVGTFINTKYTRIVTAYTVATLPAAGTVGREARVSDGDAGLAWGATVVNTGAGATPYLVWDNGTNWTVVGK